MPDATADQGAEERVARAMCRATLVRHGLSGDELQRTENELWADDLPEAQAALAALPLQASCVGLMEDLHSLYYDRPEAALALGVHEILHRYEAALKAAQEKPSAD